MGDGVPVEETASLGLVARERAWREGPSKSESRPIGLKRLGMKVAKSPTVDGKAGVLPHHLETDASLNPQKTEKRPQGGFLSFAGGGIVLRGPDLTLVASRSIPLGLVPSATYAEYSALVAGLELATALKIEHLRIRNDNLSLVRYLNGETGVAAGETARLAERVRELRTRFATFDLRWAPSTHSVRRRDDVFSADYLARKAAGLRERQWKPRFRL